MYSVIFSSTLLIAILSIRSIQPMPMAWPSEPESAPKNPFAPSNPFGRQRQQQDLPLPQASVNQPGKPFANSPTGIGFNDGENAAFWPTPPPIGGVPSSSNFREAPRSPAAFQPANPNPVWQQDSQPFNPDLLITPPPIPGFDGPARSYPKTPGDAHVLAQTKNKPSGFGNSPSGNPFNKLPLQQQQQSFDVNNNNYGKKNPFDSLPIRSRQIRQAMPVHDFGPNPNKPWPGSNPNPMSNPTNPSPVNPNPMANNFPKTPGDARFAQQTNPASGIANPANPSMGPLQNPNGIPANFQSNPALRSAFLPPAPNNQLQPPVVPPSSVSGFPNTNGQVVLGRSPSLPDIGEQKTLLPSQMADPSSLVLSQNGPLREHKLLLPSQIQALNQGS